MIRDVFDSLSVMLTIKDWTHKHKHQPFKDEDKDNEWTYKDKDLALEDRIRTSTWPTPDKYLYSVTSKEQELIRRWDSERELFYDDIDHVQASAYAHWTDFLISTINVYARPNLCT